MNSELDFSLFNDEVESDALLNIQLGSQFKFVLLMGLYNKKIIQQREERDYYQLCLFMLISNIKRIGRVFEPKNFELRYDK